MISETARAFLADFVAFSGLRLLKTGALVALGGLVEGFGLILIVPLLAIATPDAAGSDAAGVREAVALFSWLGIEDRLHRLALVLGLFAVAMVARALLLAWRQVAIAQLEIGYQTQLQSRIIGRLGNASWTKVSSLRHARVTHLLSHDIYQVGDAATGLLQSAVALIMLSIQGSIALWLDWRLTMVVFAMLAVTAFASIPMLRAARVLGTYATGANLALLNDAGQFLGALKLAVSQNLQPRFVADFSQTLSELAEAEIAYTRRQGWLRLRLAVIAALASGVSAYVGIGLLMMPIGTLVALLVVLSRMTGPATQLQSQALETVRALPAFAQVRALDTLLAEPAQPGGQAMPALTGDIHFSGVAYQHIQRDDNDAPAGLIDLTLTIPNGSFLGIAGASGAGKTTFADLLVGLCEPQSGTITIGEKPLEASVLPAWRDTLAYVSQDPFLRHDTVRANLLWSVLGDVSDADIDWALKMSGADAVIAKLPEGIDTLVGERGSLISGGERQRIAIARALLRRPRLLILDEGTNAIDVGGERALLERLDALRPDLTIVMIAHRLESLARCDHIVMLGSGRMVAEGDFHTLKPHIMAMGLRETHEQGNSN